MRFQMPKTSVAELAPFVESLAAVPKSGVHNPYKNPERYVQCVQLLCSCCSRPL